MEKFFALLSIFLAFAISGTCTDIYSKYDFPEGFVFGAGSSAYQWEGAVAEDGRTPSVWDTFCHTHFNENGDIACDGYHKYKEDVKLMVDTGLDVFRFSISWSRLITNGRGPINQKGLQFYKNLIQELVSHGIEPHVTLYHYDLPQYLEDEYGGWLNKRIIKDFTAFADVCFREFGEHVKFWTTINEGNIFSIGGYNNGDAPPGRCSKCLQGNSSTEPYIAGHNLLLAHASVSRLYRQKYKDIQGGSIGFSIFTIGLAPATSNDSALAAQRANDFYIGWFLRPLIYGDYPDTMKKTLGSRMPVFSEEESEQVKGSADFIGIIQYLAAYVTKIKSRPFVSESDGFYLDMAVDLNFYANFSAPEYYITPWGLESVLEYVKENYGNPPIYILENGTPMSQYLPLKKKDSRRVEFLRNYIAAVLRSIRNGSDTRGYIVWSFLDLYEIRGGYSDAYGMYYVNFSDPHRSRSPKLSALWYSDFLKGKTVSLDTQGITKMQSNLSSST